MQISKREFCMIRRVHTSRSKYCFLRVDLIHSPRCSHQYSYSTQASEEKGRHSVDRVESSRRRLLPQQVDLLDIYRGLVAAGRIQYDEAQIRVVMELRRLQKKLQDYSPPAFASQYYLSSGNSRISQEKHDEKDSKPWYSTSSADEVGPIKNMHAIMKLRSHSEELAELRTPKGLLLIGPPGCGKSFLIDLWLSAIPTPYKVRKHYNELVLEIYRGVWEESKLRTARLHSALPSEEDESQETPWTKSVRDRWRSLLKTGSLPSLWNPNVPRTYSSYAHDPPIPFVIAHRLVLQHWLLVFDELQLLDVSSAGLLSDVLSWFWRMGGVMVATSNKVPDDLYKNGVQRERLEPFVEALKVRCPVSVMRGEKDWRRIRSDDEAQSTWFTYAHEDDFNRTVKSIASSDSSSIKSFNVFGRELIVPWSSGDTCNFTFAQLCEESLGPADYLTIASNYKNVIITDIPILRVSAKNQSRRFISLIDALYEARCRIVALAESQPDGLFFPDAIESASVQIDDTTHEDQIMAEAISESREAFRPNVSSYENMPELPAASPLSIDSLSIFSGEEERFAYRRALSRLIEMTSRQYAEAEEWNPLAPSLRKWESKLRASEATPLPLSHQSGRRHEPQQSDYAFESALESEARNHRASKERPSAPRLKEDHIWGVRDDWGPRAGAWGKGARVYQEGSGPEGDDHDDVLEKK